MANPAGSPPKTCSSDTGAITAATNITFNDAANTAERPWLPKFDSMLQMTLELVRDIVTPRVGDDVMTPYGRGTILLCPDARKPPSCPSLLSSSSYEVRLGFGATLYVRTYDLLHKVLTEEKYERAIDQLEQARRYRILARCQEVEENENEKEGGAGVVGRLNDCIQNNRCVSCIFRGGPEPGTDMGYDSSRCSGATRWWTKTGRRSTSSKTSEDVDAAKTNDAGDTDAETDNSSSSSSSKDNCGNVKGGCGYDEDDRDCSDANTGTTLPRPPSSWLTRKFRLAVPADTPAAAPADVGEDGLDQTQTTSAITGETSETICAATAEEEEASAPSSSSYWFPRSRQCLAKTSVPALLPSSKDVGGEENGKEMKNDIGREAEDRKDATEGTAVPEEALDASTWLTRKFQLAASADTPTAADADEDNADKDDPDETPETSGAMTLEKEEVPMSSSSSSSYWFPKSLKCPAKAPVSDPVPDDEKEKNGKDGRAQTANASTETIATETAPVSSSWKITSWGGGHGNHSTSSSRNNTPSLGEEREKEAPAKDNKPTKNAASYDDTNTIADAPARPSNTCGSKWTTKSGRSRKPPAGRLTCHVCGNPVCHAHAKKSSNIFAVCLDCSSDLDFLDQKLKPHHPDLANTLQKLAYYYTRMVLQLNFCIPRLQDISSSLTQMQQRHSHISLGTSGLGFVGAALGVAGAATMLTPAGPALLIAAIATSTTSGTLQAGHASYKSLYTSQTSANQLSDKVIGWHGLCLGILRALEQLRVDLLTESEYLQQQSAGSVGENNGSLLTSRRTASHHNLLSREQGETGGILNVLAVDGFDTKRHAMTDVSVTSSMGVQAINASLQGVPVVGAAFAVGCMAMDVHNISSLIKELQRPSDKAQALRRVQTSFLVNIPNTIVQECKILGQAYKDLRSRIEQLKSSRN